MINLLLQAVYAFVAFLIGLFPAGAGLPTELHDAVIFIGGYVGILDPIVPTATLLTCVTLVVTVEIAVWGFKAVRWAISHIPFFGGKGNS